MFFLVLQLSLIHLTSTIQCTDNCSMIYSIDQQFVLPSNCNYISAEHCSVKIVYWYDRGNYSVQFISDSLYEQHMGDQRDFLMIETAKNHFFSFDIHHICKEIDDCARIFAEQKILQMTKQFYNISKLYFDLRRVLYDKNSVSKNLACFDMNDGVRQCTVPGMSGSCQIIDDLIKHKFHRRLCLHTTQESASVNIYDSGSFAMMTVKCNRMLCNGPLTIAAVKKILYRHNITDIDGRISGSSSAILLTHYLFIFMTFLSFQIN